MPPLRNCRRENSVAPLLALNPDTVYSVNEVIAGIAGGSVGVLGTLIQLELKQVQHERGGGGRDSRQGVWNLFCSVGVAWIITCPPRVVSCHSRGPKRQSINPHFYLTVYN